MRIQMTLDVSDAARMYIAQLAHGETTETKGLATREAVIEYLKAHIARLHEDGAALPQGRLSEEESRDAREAITYLRAQGKSDGQIRAWLLLQRARFNFGPQADLTERVA